MIDNTSQKKLGCLLLICVYCNKRRNDNGRWDYVFESYGSAPISRISHGICPECMQMYFPDEYTFLCKGEDCYPGKQHLGL